MERNGILVVNDAYNACPEAMLCALQALPKPSIGGKVIAILGEMAALGTQTVTGHLRVAQEALAYADIIFFIGGHWKVVQALCTELPCSIFFYSSVQEVERVLPNNVRAGDVVLLKGSRSVALESLLNVF